MKNLLLLTIMIAFNMQAQVTSKYHVFVDLTDPVLIETFKNDINKSIPSILSQAGIKYNKNQSQWGGENGIQITFYSLANLQGIQTNTIYLKGREIPWYENAIDRDDEVKDFLKRIPKELNKLKEDAFPRTRIYDNLVYNLDKINNKNSQVILYSDLFENYVNLTDVPLLELRNVTFIRGIANQLDQIYIQRGDEYEKAWKALIKGLKVKQIKL